MAQDTLKKYANALAAANDADVILVNASMDRGNETKFIDKLAHQERRTNASVLIVTAGGDADVAYRIARCLQAHYTKITGLISGQCKSAGTLLAIGAHELAFSDHGELGPLDVQLRKADDMWAATSGLTVMNAFTALQQKSEEAFAEFALSIKARSGGSVTYKTAADIAQKLTVGLFAHIYQQVEVMHVGEAARAMKIAEEYGSRLDALTDNLEPGALGTLIAGYPSHGFVIDRKEAETLFKRVRDLTGAERQLCDELGQLARYPSTGLSRPVYFLSDPPAKTATATVAKDDGNGQRQADRGDQEKQAAGAEGAAGAAAPANAAGEAAPDNVVQLQPQAGTAGGGG
jgi:hypothetical protein